MCLKICSKCKQEKDIEQFNKKKASKDGHDSICKACQHEYDKARKDKKKEYNKTYGPKYYEEHKEYLKTKQRQYYQNNIEHYYEYEKERSKRPERIEYTNKRNIRYRQENLEKLRKWDRQRHEQNKLNRNFSQAICMALKGAKSDRHWETLVPYNLEQLKQHLGSQFTSEMSWNNYGSYWEIDHIIPQNLFNIIIAESRDFQICWSLLNLRPLEKSANRSRPKDGRDIPQEVKDKILGQNLDYGIMSVENKEESKDG
nr:endonuclease VII [uncultured phage]CAI9752228.1 endonuclease VII [uncultured phage]